MCSIDGGVILKKKPEENVCLSETQMEHIIDAAREEKGACPKATAFVKSFRPKEKGLESVGFLEKKISKKVDDFLGELQRWF